MMAPSVAGSDDDPFTLERFLRYSKKPTPSQGTTSSDGDPFSLEKYLKPPSIMNRKIETRGLATSFSSNVGRRLRAPTTPTSTSPAAKHNDDSDKKVIYNWLENTKELPHSKDLESPDRVISQPSTLSNSTGHSRPESDHEANKIYGTPVSKTFPVILESPLPNTPTAPESYELDLLNYKQFFNNRPLGRCLDDDQPEGELFQREHSALEIKPIDIIPQVGLMSYKEHEVSVQPEEGVDELDEVYSNSEYSEEGGRHSSEIHKYWDDIRLRLWIPDEELDELVDGRDDEDQEVTAPSSPTPKTPSTSSRWVMMAAPSKWSFASAIEGGNTFLREEYPWTPYSSSRPCSLEGMDTDDKIKEVDGFFSESDEVWAAHQSHAWEMSLIPGEYPVYYKDYKQTKERMTDFDEVFAVVGPNGRLRHVRRPTL